MNEHTKKLLGRACALIERYRSRGITLEELQMGMTGIASAFEGDAGNELREALDKLEGDLERIRFMSYPGEQRRDALEGIHQFEERIAARHSKDT